MITSSNQAKPTECRKLPTTRNHSDAPRRADPAFSGKAIFQASPFASGSSTVIKVKVPKRVYRRLGKKKSGTMNISVLATSSNGTRNQNTLRNGLRR